MWSAVPVTFDPTNGFHAAALAQVMADATGESMNGFDAVARLAGCDTCGAKPGEAHTGSADDFSPNGVCPKCGAWASFTEGGTDA